MMDSIGHDVKINVGNGNCGWSCRCMLLWNDMFNSMHVLHPTKRSFTTLLASSFDDRCQRFELDSFKLCQDSLDHPGTSSLMDSVPPRR